MIRFSIRTAWDTAESSFAASVRQARASGHDLLDLTVSNPTLAGFRYDNEAILAALRTPHSLVYDPDPRGLRSAREAVAWYYSDHGAAIDPDALVLTASTSEAYSFLFRLLCDPGDEVLVAQPTYPLFDFLADLDDVHLRTYPLFYDYGWWIDFAHLEASIGPRTRALLVVHPNNPTGHWTTRAERTRLRELCARHNLALIIDEVFLDYPLNDSSTKPDSEAPCSFAAEDHAGVLTFVLSGMSKIAGLPQMKLAWLLTFGPDALRHEALARLEVIADTFLSVNTPGQHALPAWLAGRHLIQHQITARIRGNYAVAEASGLQVLRTDAGWSAVLRISHTAEDLLQEHGIVMHPGSFYGMAGHHIVLSLLTPTQEFAAAMHLLAAIDASTP